MIQRYGFLFHQLNYLNSFLQNHGLCQKIFSTPHFICFGLRRPGETLWLYMGRGGEYQGFWISKTSPPSNIRVQDTFLSLIRKHLMSTWISLKLDQLDRIISIKSIYYGKVQYFQYFWNGSDSYFLQLFYEENNSRWVLHKSWDSHNKLNFDDELGENDLFGYFDEVGRKDLNDKLLPENTDVTSIQSLQMEKYFTLFKQEVASKVTNNKHAKKIANIKRDLQKLSAFNELKSFLEKNPSEIPDVLSFGDLKIKFPLEANLEQRRNLAFVKLKNWKKNYLFMQERLINEENVKTDPVAKVPHKIIKPIWKSYFHQSSAHKDKTEHGKIKDSLQNCKFINLEDFKVLIAIGKNSQANDQLRNSWSKKTDYWFHLAEMPSAHLYVRPQGALVLSQEFFNEIGSILLKESGHTLGSATLLYCLAKELRPIKGKPGSVKYKNEKRILFFSK
jgi:hypothetical protein